MNGLPASPYRLFLLAAPLAGILSVLFACAHLPAGRSRPVNSIMPVINGHFTSIKRLSGLNPLPALPKENFIRLTALFEELKASPAGRYTTDGAAWERSCQESVNAVRFMERAWASGDQAGVQQALQVLMGTRDAAHNAFSGRRSDD